MLREFLHQYKNGIVGSLQGFLVLHKLDRPPVDRRHGTAVESASESPKGGSRESTGQSRTVLENRRRRNWEQKHTGELAEKEIAKRLSTVQRIFRCVLINCASVLLVLLCTYLIDLFKWSFLSTIIKYFGSLLLLPIFLSVRLLSILWFADIAGAALKYRGLSGNRIPDFSRAASDFIHAIFVELMFLAQALLIQGVDVPVLSPVFGFIYMSLLHSLYCFDYIWMSSGVSMNARLAMVEHHWPLHLGFGTLLTLATSISSNFVINGCIFGALFPFFIVSSFLVDHPSSESGGSGGAGGGAVPAIHFYYIAQTLTNRISVAVFGRV